MRLEDFVRGMVRTISMDRERRKKKAKSAKPINGEETGKESYDSDDPEYCFWEPQYYSKVKSCRYFKENNLKFLDHGRWIYTFFTWAGTWVYRICKQYMDPYTFYPLPVSDQILYWQPIFSKRVSDGLVKLDQHESSKSQYTAKLKKPCKSVLLRALISTFWWRITFILFCNFVLGFANMLHVFIVREILVVLTNDSENYTKLYILSAVLSFYQFIIAVLIDHVNFYMYRTIHVIQYSFSITIFQHGMCHRRRFANNINGSNPLNVCNQVLHSCSPDSECSKNPLFCQALRYQNKDINSRIFSFEFMDSYYISLFLESTVQIIQYIFNFLVGIYIVYDCLSISVWPLYVVYLAITFIMILIEIFNTLLLRYIYGLKDYRMNKCREVISGLDLIDKMCMGDIAHNIITGTRNNELRLLFVRFTLSFLNRLLVSISSSFATLHILDDLIELSFKLEDIRMFKTSHLMSSMIVVLKITDSMLFIPESMKFLAYSLISYFRAEYYINECSPNFYISDNKYTGSVQTSTDITSTTNQLPSDTVVYYKDATFTWVNSRENLLSQNYDLYLKNINFELKRGEMVIVTGAQGSGKSNFIKSMLGEMTLVGGSMAVVPLHTSMPIFYASQDIWLHQGTIRSNITFGYKFDENLYDTVLKAVELEYDISTWLNGDLRVVSDNAHSLSGGQRVRMELARALYAYLIFHQVNSDYNNSKCSFLMCLDSPFQGLDPYVSKSIFNNLFNIKTGLLVKDDLSVVLTTSKRYLDSISMSQDSFPNFTLYHVKDKMLEKTKEVSLKPKNTSGPSTSGLNPISPEEMFQHCESYENTPKGRPEYIKNMYENSLIVNPEMKIPLSKFKQSLRPHIIYFKSVGPFFLIFVALTLCYMILETYKYVVAGTLGDDIMNIVYAIVSPEEYLPSLATIRVLCDNMLIKVKKITGSVVAVCFLANFVLTFCCVRGCKRIHEYCINSLLNNSPSSVKIKQYTSEILTFLSSDMFMIDETFGSILSMLLILVIQVILLICVLCYYFPVCVPVIGVCLTMVVYGVFVQYVYATKNLQIASLEALSRNNFVCENAVSSSSTYRSLKKEASLLDNVMEHTDYFIRAFFFNKSFMSWACFASKFGFLVMTMGSFIIPVVYKKFKKPKIFIGNYGLNAMQTVRVMFSYTGYILTAANLEMLMCSITRFECFVPQGEKCSFLKCRNIHEENLVMDVDSYMGRPATEEEVKRSLLLRRTREFREENKRFYHFRKLSFKPKINIIHPNSELNGDDVGVKLVDVSVYTTPDYDPDGVILKAITVSAHKSEIIGIVGRTGAGKTTLLSVLQNLVEYRTGLVLLDGVDLNKLSKDVLRQVIGVLPQLPFVFKGWTIRRFLDPRKLFSDDDINDALDKCGLLNFVNELHGGMKLDSVIIPDNLNLYMPTKKKITKLNVENLKEYYQECDMLLSNSQLRTLSLARLVLYRNLFRVILVDEPPENSDEYEYGEHGFEFKDTGVPIYDLLKAYFQHCTTFVTAHNSNSLRMCNSVWILHKGIYMGTYSTEEILKENSIANIIQKFVK
ncbi:hypothetical protein MACK_003597 [Theileria orientalis]|uniref:ABC transporter n=1 Tax=Theileria orientalis TaxID=68886 RepID=A0A976SJD3_THEOR|nr:hypothetical protein MACK_003597 [Theileria orientalis]